MQQSTITVNVTLDPQRVPESITWNATESSAAKARAAKAVLLSFWDGADKAALRMDLWTKEMMVDEMADFYFQTLMTMADSFERATHQAELVDRMKKFAQEFYDRFRELQVEQNKV